jgi:glutamine amidotransferase
MKSNEAIAVVDYGAANLLSVTRALDSLGATAVITSDPAAILAARGAILPGVGAAGAAMTQLRVNGIDEALCARVAQGMPTLGICLGMQLLFEDLEEDGTIGLGILPGAAPMLPPGRKIPHMGWNAVNWEPGVAGTELFATMAPGAYGYFVHSYHCVPANPADACAWTEYGGLRICAAVARGSLYALQFHPEKSGAAGLAMLANWLNLARMGARREAQAS